MSETFKYNCDRCDFHTNAKSLYEKHKITGKHMTGKRTERCDKKLLDKCPNCDYTTISNTNMKLHILNNHSTKKERKEKFNYYCEHCDYGSFGKTLYNKHINSEKHKLIENIIKK